MSDVRKWTPRKGNASDASPDYVDPFNQKDVEERHKERANNYAAGQAAGKFDPYLDGGERRFRFAHVLKPGFDFSILRQYCERIVYSTDGYGDNVPNLREQLEEAMERFDPDKDVLIPIGSATICVLAATLLVRRMTMEYEGGRKSWDSFAMGVYSEGDYQFWRVPLDPSQEVYDILQR